MKLCRYDEDKLGVVIGDQVHDVTEAQTQIRAAARYDMKGDAVIAALPAWRSRIEEMAKKAPGKPLSSVKLLSPVARPSKTDGGADQLREAHRGDARAHATFRARRSSGLAEYREGRHLPQVELLGGRAVRRHPDPLPRPSSTSTRSSWSSIIGKQGTDIPKDKAKDYIAGYTLGLDMTCRGREDRSFRKSIDGYSVLGPWFVTADEIANPGRRHGHAHQQRRAQADRGDQGPDLRYRPADRIRLVVLHALSGRRLLHRHAAGCLPGEARRRAARRVQRGRRVRDQGARAPGGWVAGAFHPSASWGWSPPPAIPEFNEPRLP